MCTGHRERTTTLISLNVQYNSEEASKMKKVKMGVKPLVYPVPIILLGANVDGKPNCNTLGNFGTMYISMHAN